MKKPLRLRAVALVVANPMGEILVLQEVVTKAHIGKHKGMWSIPMETHNPGQDDQAALRQLHEEELAGLPSIQMPPRYIGAYQVVRDVWATLYATTSATYHLPPVSADHPEVRNHEWMPIEAALGLWLRRGAAEMIRDYAGGLEDVVRTYCAEVRENDRVRT